MAVYRYINALSLDVVLGAVISGLFFARLFDVTLALPVLVTLALAVWVIYTIDHLWDAYRSEAPAKTFRHQFHQRYFWVLSVLVAMAMGCGIILLWYLPSATRFLGFGLTGVVLAYFATMWLRQRQLYHKELMVAAVYTCGVVIAPYSVYQNALTFPQILVTIQFAILAFTNLLLFAYFEMETDDHHNFGSLARTIGKANTRNLITGLLVMVLLMSIVSWAIWADRKVIQNSQWIILIMTILLALIFSRPGFFGRDERYRFLGDGIFFMPLLVL